MSFLSNRECSEIYGLIKSSLISEMGGNILPSLLLNELNIYFIYKSTILKAENDFDKTKGNT